MNKKTIILSAAAALALAACGGGGSGSTATPAVANLTVPVVATPVVAAVTASSIVNAVPAPVYAVASEELAAFNLLNAERSRCGFGLLAQNPQLDVAARGHADWLLTNNYAGHYQVTGTLLFTGVTPDDRITAAGYGNSGTFSSTDDLSSAFGTNTKTGMGESQTRGLLNAPYHMVGLLGTFRDIGIAVRNSIDTASAFGPRVNLQFDLAYKTGAGPQLLGGSEVQTYPCAGSTGIDRLLSNERPNPVPGRDLATMPLGSSVYIAVREGQTLAITSTSMIKVATGVAVTLRAPLTKATDPNGSATAYFFGLHQAVVSADAPLDPNSAYQVTITGTNNGTAFSRTFSFKTGT